MLLNLKLICLLDSFSTVSTDGTAFGKGTWGKVLDIEEDSSCIDEKDPNCDTGEVFSRLNHVVLLSFNVCTLFDYFVFDLNRNLMHLLVRRC